MSYGLDILELTRSDASRPPAARAHRHGSRFETLATLSAQQSRHRGLTLDTLLAAACPKKHYGPAMLQSIWAEAMHRSCAMMRLLATRGPGGSPADVRCEHGLAHDLASLFRSLDANSAYEDVPCSNLLRDIVTDLVSVFGAEDIVLATDIARLRLPAYKRRALILATVELVLNALLHAFPDRAGGLLQVSLRSFGPARAWLQVRDDGVGFGGGHPNLGCGVAAGLADLLEADLVYFRTRTTMVAEIVFPAAERAF